MSTFSIKQIADALGRERSVVSKRAQKEKWPLAEDSAKRRIYTLADLPSLVQAALLQAHPELAGESATPAKKETFAYDSAELWAWAAKKPNKARQEGSERAAACRQVVALNRSGLPMGDAFKVVASQVARPWRTIRGWYYGTNGNPGAAQYGAADWDAALIPQYVGRTQRAAFSPDAVDWICKAYLNRGQPTLKDCYRRLLKAADANGWDVPSEKTVRKRIEQIPEPQRRFAREGAEALRDTFPSMRRDPRVFGPGEAVSGDGLKISLYIDWGDDILTTSTVWVWQDIRTRKLLAHHLGKTESTDVFRLSLYRLTATCLPSYYQIDNTTAAANKAMTAGQGGRRRFHDRPEDPPGVILQLGGTVHWSDPNHDFTTPGSKTIERPFRDLHPAIKNHPQFHNRGYSMATAIPVAELYAVIEEEIARHNAQRGRRTVVCQGIKSFDDAWHAAVQGKTLPVASTEQRELCLLLPEVVHVNSRSGHIEIAAGRSDLGKPRYWTETLAGHAGQKVVAYYDPDDLSRDVRIQSVDGVYLCHAERLPDTAFNDSHTAREHRKAKARYLKSQKAQARELTRMSDLEFKRAYPEAVVPAAPEPRVHQARFGKKRLENVDGDWVDPDTGEIIERQRHVAGSDLSLPANDDQASRFNFDDLMERRHAAWKNGQL